MTSKPQPQHVLPLIRAAHPLAMGVFLSPWWNPRRDSASDAGYARRD